MEKRKEPDVKQFLYDKEAEIASIGEANTGEGSLYRYLSSAISQTIIDSLDLYLDEIRLYDVFIQFAFPENFFEGLSRYVLPKAFCMDAGRI